MNDNNSKQQNHHINYTLEENISQDFVENNNNNYQIEKNKSIKFNHQHIQNNINLGVKNHNNSNNNNNDNKYNNDYKYNNLYNNQYQNMFNNDVKNNSNDMKFTLNNNKQRDSVHTRKYNYGLVPLNYNQIYQDVKLIRTKKNSLQNNPNYTTHLQRNNAEEGELQLQKQQHSVRTPNNYKRYPSGFITNSPTHRISSSFVDEQVQTPIYLQIPSHPDIIMEKQDKEHLTMPKKQTQFSIKKQKQEFSVLNRIKLMKKQEEYVENQGVRLEKSIQPQDKQQFKHDNKNVSSSKHKFHESLKQLENDKFNEKLVNSYQQDKQLNNTTPLPNTNEKQQQKLSNKIQIVQQQQLQNDKIIVHFENIKNQNLLQKNQIEQNNIKNEIKSDIIFENNNIQQFHKNSQQQQYNTSQTTTQFNYLHYKQILPILKNLKKSLKNIPIDIQSLIHNIKKYLEILSNGTLDSIEQLHLPLHKRKIVKNAMFYQRLSIIVLSFNYATHNLHHCNNYLLNLFHYTITNNQLMLKILQQYLVNQTNNVGISRNDKLQLKSSFDTIRNNNDVLNDCICKLSKKNEVFYTHLKQVIKLINRSSLEQTFYNILQYFALFLCLSELHHMIPFLAVSPNPYLPLPISNRYTLVIDVIQVFCYGTQRSKHTFRPYSQHFLQQMNQYYDIVSFTDSFPIHIDKVIDLLDPHNYIRHRLYKHHGIQFSKRCYKDLQRIGRNMKHLMLLDSESPIYSKSESNSLLIPSWKGGKNDLVLAELCPILAMIPLKKLDCITALKKIKQQLIKNNQSGVKYFNFGINLQ